MSNKNLSRRDFLRASAVAASGAAMASTIPGAFAAPPAQDSVAIQYWTFWSQYGAAVEAFQEDLNAYVAPNTVEVTTGVGIDEAFIAAVSAGTPPDIGTGVHYADYMANGQAADIGELVAASDVLKAEFFSPPAWEGTFWGGVQYGISGIEAFVRRGLNYNSRLVEEAGLDPDSPPQTWPEVLEWHNALTKFDDAGNLIQIGLDPYDAEGGLFAAHDGSFQAESWGFEWWDPETQTFNLNNEMMAESFDVMGEFVKIIGPDNLNGLRAVEGQGGWGGSFNAEVQAMIIEGYWHPGETQVQKPEVAQYNRATWVPVPEARRGAKLQLAGGHMVFCFTEAVNPAAVAFPVGEFINTPAHCDPVYNLVGWLPAYLPYLETVDPSIYPGLDFYINSLTEATEMWGIVRMETMSFIERKHREIRERHFRGELTGAQAAEEMQREAELNWEESGFGTM